MAATVTILKKDRLWFKGHQTLYYNYLFLKHPKVFYCTLPERMRYKMYDGKRINGICNYYENVLLKAKRAALGFKHNRYVATVVQFDLPNSTQGIIRNQPRTIEKMLKHNKICSDLIERKGGVVIKEMGDAVLATFPSIASACICSILVICNLKKFGGGVRTKVTLTRGSVHSVTSRKEPDVYGVAVNLCNRMATLAKVDTILFEANHIKQVRHYLLKDPKIKIGKPFRANLKEFEEKSLCRISVEC